MARDTDRDHNEHTDPQGVGLVVVGHGDSIRTYVDALESVEGARIVGVVDRSGMEGRAVADGDLQWTADLSTTLKWAGVEAYVVAESMSGDQEVREVISETRKPVFFGLQASRHRVDVRTVRRLIESGDLGDVVFARFAEMADLEREGSAPEWPNDLRGGDEHRLRMIDAMRSWIQDEPRSVFAQQNASERGDYECITVRFEGGATAVFEFGSSVGRQYREVFVVGTAASTTMSWTDHTTLLLPAEGAALPIGDSRARLDVILSEWLRDLAAGRASDDDFEGIARTLAIDEAVKRSIDSGEAVDVEPTKDSHA